MSDFEELIETGAWAAFSKQVAHKVNTDQRLVRRGRYFNTTFGWGIGDQLLSVRVENGPITVAPGFAPDGTDEVFRLTASPESWIKFSRLNPRPGYHDIFAMIDKCHAVAQGDLLPFFTNILYVKGVFNSICDRTMS